MNVNKLANANASTITVTSTATSLYSLMDTAAGVANNLPTNLDAVDITVENGDIRMLADGNAPTATAGLLLRSGMTHRLRGLPASKIQLISVSGVNVTASVEVGFAESGDLVSTSGGAPINTQFTLLPSAARSTTQTSPDLNNSMHRGVEVILDVTAIGTGNITLSINGKDPASGKYYTILTGAAISANGTTVYKVYPGLAAVANSVANDVLPKTYQIVVTANNANPVTYSVGVNAIV